MTRASYPVAIAWLALHDQWAWAYEGPDAILPPAAHLVADLFDKPARIVAFDVRAFRLKEGLA